MTRLSRADREFVTVLRTGQPALDPHITALYEKAGRAAANDAREAAEYAEDKAFLDSVVQDFTRGLVADRMTVLTGTPSLRVIQGGV